MKKILALAVSLALILSGAALSESAGTNPGGDPITQTVEKWSPYALSVVTEANGVLYFQTQGGDPSNTAPVLRVLENGGEKALSPLYASAVYVEKDNAIYFQSAGNSRLLMALDLASGQIQQAMDLGFDGAALTGTMNGLMAGGLIGKGVYANRLYDPLTKQLVPADIEPMSEYHNFGTFETMQTAAGGLKARAQGSELWQSVEPGPAACQAALDGALYTLVPREFLESAYAEIYRFDPATGLCQYQTQADGRFYSQLLTDNSRLVLTGPDGVLSIDPATGASEMLYQPEAKLLDPSVIKAGGQLFLFARPDAESQPQLIIALPQPGAQPEPTPAPERDLVRGMRGADVKKLQARLSELGYPAGREDGVFGVQTDSAVRYFQDALGTKQNGRADKALREALYAGDAPMYVEFTALTSASRGIRVEALQARLRDLSYLAAPADGSYGSRTVEAVRLFQKEAGLKQTGNASVQTLEALTTPDAPVCSGYITLKKGDTGASVEALQTRLNELGYYAGDASGAFDGETLAAVKLFQQTAGLKQDGVASAKLQRTLFSSKAPKCDQYIELRYGDSGPQVKALQTRLKKLGYFSGSIGGNFGSRTLEAVKRFQKATGVKQTGAANVSLQEALFEDDAPTPTPKPTPTAKPTPTPAPTSTPMPTPKPTVGPTPAPTATAVPTAEPTLTPEPTPTVEPTPTPEPTPAPTIEPTPTPEPTPTIEPVLEGQVVDNAAVDKLMKLLNDQKPGPKILYTRETAVLWLQQRLTDMKYFDPAEGDNSGVYDQPTFDAVKQLQQDLALELKKADDGLVGQTTFDAILGQGAAWTNPGEVIHRS